MEKDAQKPLEPVPAEQQPATWEPMELTYVADVRDIAMPGILKAPSAPETSGGRKLPGPG
ncbi:MAG: hypothetical protein M3Z04_02760 [Chloroflexota bacterium]|nr:hypothetical protein [Chloroflexota bacterium]